MDNLPKGNTLKTHGDLQNVITGIILRQNKSFSKTDIYSQVEKWCENSVFDRKREDNLNVDMNQRIDDTLNILHTIGVVKVDVKTHKYELTIGFPAVNTLEELGIK